MMKQAKNCIRKRLKRMNGIYVELDGISVEENRISCFIGLPTVGNVSNVRAGIKPNKPVLLRPRVRLITNTEDF